MKNYFEEEEEEEDEERRVLPVARAGVVKNRITRTRMRMFLKFIFFVGFGFRLFSIIYLLFCFGLEPIRR